MPYLGNPPAEAYTSTVKDSFSGDGSTTAFTLSQPSTTNDLRVVVENVIQDPTVAYSVSGTTLTFTSAPPTGTNNIYAVNLGPAVQTVVPPDGVTVTDLNAYADGAVAFTANRATSDGTIIDLQKSGSSIGTLGIEGGDLVVDGGSGHVGVRFMAGTLRPRDAGTVSDGGVDLGASNGRWQDLYLSGGVYLGGTGSANYLQDFETGTFTPTVNNGTLTFNRAAYTKIGNTVHLWIANLSLSNYTDTSTLQIESLPFAASAASGYSAVGSVMCSHRDNSIAIMPYMSSGADYIRFYENSDTGSFFPFSNASLVSSASNGMYLSITYQSGS